MKNPELTSTIVQAVTSVVAVVIAIYTLMWTTKSQRDANKPYVVAYLQQITSSQTKSTYLTIKNFGKTGAKITNVISTPSLDNGLSEWDNNPFSKFTDQLIAPNQSYAAGISILKSTGELKTKNFNLEITYLDQNNKEIKSNFHLDESSLDDIQHFISVPTHGEPIEKAIYRTSGEQLINKL